MVEDWKQSIDTGKMVGTISVDLSKAFGSLPHGLLSFQRMELISIPVSFLPVIFIIATKGINWAT